MAKVLVDESSLTNIANALRTQARDTVLITHDDIMAPVTKISKTSNVIDKDNYTKGYGNSISRYEVVTIPGASTIKVELTYQTESANYDYIQIMSGKVSSASGSKYGGTTLTTKEITFTNTDTITIFFKSDSSNDSYFGYYAVVTGLDADGNQIVAPETNTFKPSEMAQGILALPVPGVYAKVTFVKVTATNTGTTNGMTKTFNIGDYLAQSVNNSAIVLYENYNGQYLLMKQIIDGKASNNLYRYTVGDMFSATSFAQGDATYENGILSVLTTSDKYSGDYITLIYINNTSTASLSEE